MAANPHIDVGIRVQCLVLLEISVPIDMVSFITKSSIYRFRRASIQRGYDPENLGRFPMSQMYHCARRQSSSSCIKMAGTLLLFPWLLWPGNSPDLNMIELCWMWMKEGLRKGCSVCPEDCRTGLEKVLERPPSEENSGLDWAYSSTYQGSN